MSYTFTWPEPVCNNLSNDSHSPVTIPKFGSPKTRSGKRRAAKTRSTTATDWPIIVHCHLCWDWVWQRPQQFVSRLSTRHKVLFVETRPPDPGLAAPLARFEILQDFPNITVLRIQFPEWRWSDGAYVDAERRRLVREFLNGPMGASFRNPVQWFYDPMAVRAFGGQMEEILNVYDCMDELSKFRGAPPEIIEREAELLERAEVVFTGGRKLHESKSRAHSNCHFYGCGVEWNHFGRAREANTEIPGELAGLAKPVLGFFGVVDERMDYDLVAALADADPKWSIVMVGPATKVDNASLPQRANLHWLGQRSYADLPALCKAFDVCLMPFALNESTEFINPTKALEYMAAGRPIVSTAVPDVVRNFGSVIRIARNRQQFIGQCRESVTQPDGAAIERGLQMARDNSWESIVTALENHVQEALAKKQAGR